MDSSMVMVAPKATHNLGLSDIQSQYATGRTTPEALLRSIYPGLEAAGCAFIHLVPLSDLIASASALLDIPPEQRGPLWGVPCAVKDNVDVGGMPTTAACPAYAYTPATSGPAVQRLQDAGVLIVGKTNLDQFAAGLVGTRSPYGAPATPFDSRFISGGSSSGSGMLVGGGLVTFALGTDTAGSGRIPAGLCGCVGIKGTVGMISTVGVVPAAPSLDCLTVFARSVEDAAVVMRVMRLGSAGPKDVWRRLPPAHIPCPPSVGFRFAVPKLGPNDWRCGGGEQQAQLAAAEFEAAVARLKSLGAVQVDDFDMTPFATVAAMLYGTAFIGERYSALRPFLEKQSETNGSNGVGNGVGSPDGRLLPVTWAILSGAGRFNAADVYDANAMLAMHRAAALHELRKVDLILVPTALAHYTQQEIQAEESASPPRWTQNANLGRFTNFVNLLDMCGVAVPSGVMHLDAEQAAVEASASAASGACSPEQAAAVAARATHLKDTGSTKVTLPFGVTLLAPAWHDEWLWGVGAAMHRASGLGCGPAGHGVATGRAATTRVTEKYPSIASMGSES